jgi:hypothetical protein
MADFTKTKNSKNKISINGIGSDNLHLVLKFEEKINQMISFTKDTFSEDEIFFRLTMENPNLDLYQGARFSDTNHLTYLIASGISNFLGSEKTSGETIYKRIENFFYSLNNHEKIDIVLESYKAAAKADHWYYFEKQYE